MKHKKSVLSASILVALLGTVHASTYKIVVTQEKNIYDVVENVTPVATPWADFGAEFNCVKTYNPYDFNLGTTFTQIENCEQEQKRTITTTEIFNGTPRTTVEDDFQIIPVTISYLEEGQENFNTGTQRKEYSEWVDSGSHHSCLTWTPLEDTINLDENFTQNRNCSQDQTRIETVYEIWANGSETFLETNNESQTITEQESQNAVGTKNFNTGSQRDEYTSWVNSGSHYDCLTWIPDISLVNFGESFTQDRNCSQDQERVKTVYDIWADGSETLDSTTVESQTLTETESQPAIGTKNYNTGSQRSDYTSWEDSGVHYACETWSPLVSTVNLGEGFTQNRDCSQDQTRIETVYDVWADGTETVASSTTNLRILTETESQGAVGIKNYNTGTQRIEYTEWLDEGVHYNCGTFAPLPSEVYRDTSYEQNRDCSQDQTRVKTTYDIWADGSETTFSIEDENQTIIEIESNNEIGTLVAESCKEILNGLGSVGSGLYEISLESGLQQVYCDMETDGGGWTLVAAQDLYVQGYPTPNNGIPNDDPNNVQHTRLTDWPMYSEYGLKSIIDLHGALDDASLSPHFTKDTTGSFGEVNVDMMSFLLDKTDYQNGRASDDYVKFDGVPWGDSQSHASYYGYRWFDQNNITHNYWGQADVWGHLIDSNLFRIASTESGYARPSVCGRGWAQNACRLAMSAWVNRDVVKQKVVFMVR